MPKTVTSTEAQAQFGSMLKWAKENNDEIVVKLYGEPAVVLMSYSEYERVETLRKHEAGREALQALEAIRQRVGTANPDLMAEDAYRLAGFSEDVIQETLQMDEKLAKVEQ